VVFKDGLNLDPHNKDSVKKVVRHWIVELGEIDATFRRADLSALKAFITSDRDVMRMPYSRREQSFFRRTALCGTVNSRFFLHDQTGNRRFWTIACKSVDSYHTIDMQQAWAQVYELYKNGEGWRLTKQELDLVNDVNKEHEMLDYAACKVATFYDWELPCSNWKTVAEIADDLGIRSPTRGDLTSIGMAVAELNGGQRRRGHKGNLLAVPKKQGADFSWPQPD
jgi:putative DNA primase/helicase